MILRFCAPKSHFYVHSLLRLFLAPTLLLDLAPELPDGVAAHVPTGLQ